MTTITPSNYTREAVKADINKIYVFTENAHSIITSPNRIGGGSAVIRGLPNAYPIVTKKKYDYDTKENVDYSDTDEDFEQFILINRELINNLIEVKHKVIIFPQGFASDKATMPKRFAIWLKKELYKNFGLVTKLTDTENGLISVGVDGKSEILFDYTNHSGGAYGSDHFWDEIGKKFGMMKNFHYWSVEKTPYGNFKTNKEDDIEGQQKVTLAARQMGRIEQTHQVRDSRLIRNWSQVKYSDAIFAITTILKIGDEMNYGKKALIIQGKGGTGYAIQMAINENKPVYVFDQVREKWCSNINGVWKRLEEPPILTKNFAGIGTREINEAGLKAIEDVYRLAVQHTIYNNLHEKTNSGNIIINPVFGQAGVNYAKIEQYIFSLRVKGYEKHFGNPFSSDPILVKKDGLIQVPTTKDAVLKYIDWVLYSTDSRAEWIRSILSNGTLKNRRIVYYKELNEPSHANALDYLINKVF